MRERERVIERDGDRGGREGKRGRERGGERKRVIEREGERGERDRE